MKHARIFVIALGTLAFAACQQEKMVEVETLRPIRFTASFEATKATDTAFEAGDKVGLTISEPVNVANEVLTMTDSGLVPDKTLYWPVDMEQEESAVFYAWAPSSYWDATFNPTYTWLKGMGGFLTKEEYMAEDLLVATITASPKDESVHLSFRHAYSRFKLTVVSHLLSDTFTGVQTDQTQSVSIDGLSTEVSVNMSENSYEATGEALATCHPYKAAEYEYWLIVAPQSASPEISIQLESGKVMKYVAAAPIAFTSGKQISATLTLDEDKLSFTYDIQPWEEDDTPVSFIQKGESQPDNEIWYTSTDGKIVEPSQSTLWPDIVSNTYQDGRGILKFDGAVTTIPGWVFRSCSTLEKISMPNSVVSLGGSAFAYCTALKEVRLSENLESIGRFAFTQCALTSITLPETLENIEAYNIFEKCDKLESINGKFASEDHRCLIVNNELLAFAPAGLSTYEIPDGITAIKPYAFYGLGNILSVVLPSGLKTIETHSFGDTGLETITIPDSVESIGTHVFYDCRSLAAFYGNYASEDHRCLIVGTTMMSIAPSGLTEYTIPEGVETIAECAIGGFNYSLETLHLPSTLKTIGQEAFERCYKMKEIVIPAGVETIENYAFQGCPLSKVTVEATTPPVLGKQVFVDNDERVIYVPAESVEAYKTAEGWSDYADIIQAISDIQPANEIWYVSTTGEVVEFTGSASIWNSLVSNTYENGKGILKFSEDVTYISFSSGGDKVCELYLPEGLTSIGALNFRGFAIESITIPQSVVSIQDYNPFRGCPNLKAFYGKFATEDHLGLTNGTTFCSFASGVEAASYSVPEGVESIGIYAFYNCKLSEIILPSSLRTIRSAAFEGCTCTAISLPEGLVTIEGNAISYCRQLTSITIPNSVEHFAEGEYPYNPFTGCEGLTAFYGKYASEDHRCLIKDKEVVSFAPGGISEYTVEEGIESIGWTAFERCHLDRITLPSTLKEIKYSAFSVTNLKDIYMLATEPPTVGDHAFYLLSNSNIYVPAGSLETYKAAEFWSGYADKIYPIELIEFTDAEIKADLVSAFDLDGDGELSILEARKVTSLQGVFSQPASWGNSPSYQSFDEFAYFTGVKTIESDVFHFWGNLSSIVLPESIQYISDLAFCNCYELAHINLPESLEFLGLSAFFGCYALEEVTIPKSVQTIEYSLFEACKGLRAIYGKYASDDHRCLIIEGALNSFAYNGLDEYTIPQDVTVIGDSALRNCHYDGKLILNYNITRIEAEGFAYSWMPSIMLNDGIEYIGSSAFRYCSVESFNIPASVKYIGDGAFISRFTQLTFNALTPPVIGSNVFGEEGASDITYPIYVPAESINVYKSADGWRDFADRIQAIPTE